MSSRFYFGGSDSGSDVDENDSSLPFPKPLDRTAFLTPDFDATEFLSSLSNRFQTLEDLQTELRELSQTLNKELVDLVNDNYHDFLSLGSTLSGGEEKIQDIRVGLLGFQRDVKAVRDKVDGRRNDVAELLHQKKALRQETSLGRTLLDIAERLDLLEEKLKIPKAKPADPAPRIATREESGNHQWSEAWTNDEEINESDDDYDSDETVDISPRVRRRTDEFLMLKHLVDRQSPQHPFILAQDGRLRKVQETLLSDLDLTIRKAPEVKIKQQLLQIRAAVEG